MNVQNVEENSHQKQSLSTSKNVINKYQCWTYPDEEHRMAFGPGGDTLTLEEQRLILYSHRREISWCDVECLIEYIHVSDIHQYLI